MVKAKTNKYKITYLLGAGASANAIPVLSEFGDVMYLFKKFLGKFGSKRNFDALDDFLKFTSIDSYARHLFLAGKNEEYSEIKELITLFLLYNQSGHQNNQLDELEDYIWSLKDIDNIEKTDKIKRLKKLFQTEIDPRYYLFFGSILSKISTNGPEWPENVKIISWNYDSQIELVLNSYISDNHDVTEKYNIYPNSELVTKSVFGKQSYNIVRLNGVGNFYDNDGFLFNFSSNSMSEDFKPFSLLFDKDGYIKSKYRSNNLMRFAWQHGVEHRDNLRQLSNKYAQTILSQTDILVIIGYTFPSFNRDVDSEIFRNSGGISKVYYQVPEFEYVDLSERLHCVLKKSSLREITNISGLNQFHIPNEYYLNKPPNLPTYVV